MKILGFVGSLRSGSYNRMLFGEFCKRLPPGFEVEEGVFNDWPLFNQDNENPFPPFARAMQENIQGADAILIVTPEFNRSIPGGLKNMLDWTSRGERKDCWSGKKVYIMGASSGTLGTVTAQYDLRRVMLYFGATVMGVPEFFLGKNKEKFVEGALVDEQTINSLEKAVAAFASFVSRT